MTMSMTLSGSDLQGDCPDHTQTYCYGCKSAYTQCKSAYTHSASLHKYIQCKHTSTQAHTVQAVQDMFYTVIPTLP